MKCSYCNTEIENNKPINPLLYAHTYGIPFFCTFCGAIKFNYRAIRDIVFLWPIPLTRTYVEEGVVERPESSIDSEDEVYGRSNLGIVLSVGPGYYDNKRFHPTNTLERGMKILYDKNVPWRTYVKDNDGKSRMVVFCGFKDIWSIVEDVEIEPAAAT